MSRHHLEGHVTRRIGWLRAAVLGANDGVVSTAALILGVSAAQDVRSAILIAGLASLVAGAMSMAAGEYVSVSSQADLEAAETEVERRELETDPPGELIELANIYVKRGLSRPLAQQVAEQLMAHDALDAHLRDELGISETLKARPFQAASTSAASFAAGAALPLCSAVLAPSGYLGLAVWTTSLLTLILLGCAAARLGGAPVVTGMLRVLGWGAFAMLVTSGIGALVGSV